jgi:hypothetical protein
MKKSLIYLFLTIVLFGCSSSDESNSSDASGSNKNVYFNFIINNKNYSSTDYEDIDGFGDPCWGADISKNNSEVSLAMAFTNPSDKLTYCPAVINGINNSIGTTTGCDFAMINGDETIGCFGLTVKITQVGNFYEGTFSGDFLIVQDGKSLTRSGSGSFRVPTI